MDHHQLFCKSRSLLLNMFSSQPFVDKKRKNDNIFRGLCLYWTLMHLARLSLINAQSGPYDVMRMTSQRPELQQCGRKWRKSWGIMIKMPITLFEIEPWKLCKFKKHVCSFCTAFVQQWWDIVLFFTFTITCHNNSNWPMFRSAQTDSELTGFKDQIMQEKQLFFLSISGSLKKPTLKRCNEHGGVWNGLNNFL